MPTTKEVRVPDIGNFADVDVIEVLVREGDTVEAETPLITLESEKATMEIPAPFAGKVKRLQVKVGDKVSEGSLIATMEVAEEAAAEIPPGPPLQKGGTETTEASAAIEAGGAAPPFAKAESGGISAVSPSVPAAFKAPEFPPPPVAAVEEPAHAKIHASPSVRHFARELGVNLALVKGSGPKRRILKEDVQAFVKAELARPRGVAAPGMAFALPEMPAVDFARFGPVETRPLTRIKKLSGANLHRNWVSAPHVTQHEEADITELEAFRKALSEEARQQGVRLTLLAFLIKAVVATLKAYPDFNASLTPDGENLVLKKYFHIGFAVDTPDGLVVPVIRDADRKGVLEIARELGTLSAHAREKKISPAEMQGGCFSISSLGGIGGSFFTPILNLPEVAVLGVSRATLKPVFRDGQFVPRLMLPLSLSYDHRVIDGAQGARFVTHLSQVLADVRRLLL
jgi:pyruvate dehydrogenase E2 component (dihydrolipoamide acetyltransferase)